MKNNLTFLLLFICFGLSSIVFAQPQRGGSSPSVSVITNITHATCFNPKGTIEYEIVVSSNWENEASLNTIKLVRQGDSDPIYTDNGPSLTGIISDVEVGQYTLSGSISALDNQGMWVGISFSANIWLGIETVWTEKIDMISSPNSYSAKRNALVATYGGVRSSNGIASGDGWIEMSAVFGNTTDNRVFLMVGETNPLGVFNPSSIFQEYIEFYKGSGGNGIRVWHHDTGAGGATVNNFTSISTNPSDKIRLVRIGSTLTVQKGNANATVFTLPFSYSGPMNIAVRTLATDDGCLDVVSSFGCVEQPENTIDYAELRRKLDGGYALAVGGLLKFTYNEEYSISTGFLPFNIYGSQRTIIASSDFQGTVTGISSPLVYHEDDARYIIDLTTITGIVKGQFYTLEVIDTKGSKKYLKFFYKN